VQAGCLRRNIPAPKWRWQRGRRCAHGGAFHIMWRHGGSLETVVTERQDVGLIWWAALAVALILYVYPLSLDTPLMDPGEGLHAGIAQEMVEKGDWIVPRFVGEPFLDKPILYTWAQALSMRWFGMGEATARAPGLLLAVAGAGLLGLMARRMFGGLAGALAALFYATMVLPAGLAQTAHHDVAMTPMVIAAFWALWESEQARGRRRWALAALAGVAVGLSCLAKGLTGTAIVGVGFGLYLAASRRLTLEAAGRGAVVLAVAALVAFPWFLAMEHRVPGYLRYYFLERHVLGFATPTQVHGRQRWYYYLPFLACGGIPWILSLPAAAAEAWRRRREPGARSGGGALAWWWLIGGVVFLYSARSKLVTYLWPVFPAMALLIAALWARALRGEASERARRALRAVFVGGSLAGAAVLPLAAFFGQRFYKVDFGWGVWAAFVAGGLTLWAPVALWRKSPAAALAGTALSVALQLALVMTLALSLLVSTESERELARFLNRKGRLPDKLLLVDQRVGSVVFYLKPQLRARLRPGQIARAPVDSVWDDLGRGGDRLVALPDLRARKARLFYDFDGLPCVRAGCYRVYDGEQWLAGRRGTAERNGR